MLTDSLTGRNSIYISIVVMSVSLFLFMFLCSFIGNENKIDSGHKKGESTFISYSGENHDKYEAVFSDSELKSLSKNGKVLSGDEMKENEELVYDNINSISQKHSDKDEADFVFQFNDNGFRQHMKHFTEEMKLLKPRIMKELDSMRCNFEFDIPDVQLDEKDFKIDMDKINNDLERASDEIKRSAVTIKNLDIPAITERINKEMKNAGIDLKNSKNELKKLNQFLKEIKQEMVKDKLIQNTDDKVNLKINDDGIYFNGKKLPEDLANKYKKMYKDRFGHNIHHSFEIKTEE